MKNEKHVALATEIYISTFGSPICVCDPAYKMRKRTDPSCNYCEYFDYLTDKIAAALSQVERDALRTVAATLADNSIDKIESGMTITLAPKEPEVKAQGFESWLKAYQAGPDSKWANRDDIGHMEDAFRAGQKSKAATLRLPEKKNNKLKGCDCNGCHYMQGWDAAIDAVKSINKGDK